MLGLYGTNDINMNSRITNIKISLQCKMPIWLQEHMKYEQ